MEEKKVELVFGPPPSADDRHLTRGDPAATLLSFSMSLDEITKWFKDFEIGSLELWVSGGIDTGGVIKLFVSASASGGMKVKLRPKKQPKGTGSGSESDETLPK